MSMRSNRLLPLCLATILVASAASAQLSVTRKANGTLVITDAPGSWRYNIHRGDDTAWLINAKGRPNPWDGLVEATAKEFGLDPMLVKCVILVESGGNPRAVSSKGARGLMQLMPGTARAYGVGNIFDPADNIRGGVRYLNFLLNLFQGDLNLAIAGYNAGEGAVSKYGRVPPYEETQDYVRKVLAAYNGTPQLSASKFRTSRYSRIDIRSDPGRPVFAWYDPKSDRRVISERRPPAATLGLRRLARGR
jgi:soluble lytic murein transglycosylase-like protein